MSAARAALVVAVDHHDDAKLRRLKAPRQDAEALAGVLSDPAIGGFDVELAVNRPEAELRRRLSRFFAERGRDDLLLLHFSCHGVKNDSGSLYFAAPDTDTAHLDATAIPAEFVDRLMTQSRSRRVVLMLDCCYGGAFSRGMARRAGDSADVQEPLNGTGRVVLTASSAMEFAWEGDDLQGEACPSVFTSALVRGLDTGEADRDGDQLVSVDELYQYLYEAVRRDNSAQTPGKFGSVEGDLYIARSRRPPQPAELPDELVAAMVSPSSDVREGAVRGLARLLEQPDVRMVAAARGALEAMVEDDSRRVSGAAAAALGVAQSAPVAASPPPPPPPAPVVELEPKAEPPTAVAVLEPVPPTVVAEAPPPRGRSRLPLALAVLAGAALVLACGLHWIGDSSLFNGSDSISGPGPLLGVVTLLVAAIGTPALILANRPRGLVLLPLLAGGACGVAIAGVDTSIVYDGGDALSKFGESSSPEGVILALIAAPVLFGAGLWAMLAGLPAGAVRRARDRGDIVAAVATVLSAVVLVAFTEGDAYAGGLLLIAAWILAPASLAVGSPERWPRAIVAGVSAAAAVYMVIFPNPREVGDLLGAALFAVAALAATYAQR